MSSSINQAADNLATFINTAAGLMVQAAPYDRTIEAKIVRCTNPAVASYELTVEGQQGLLTAYSDPSVVYYPGNNVYILVPKNDMHADKQIIGMTESSRTDNAGYNEAGKYLVDCVVKIPNDGKVTSLPNGNFVNLMSEDSLEKVSGYEIGRINFDSNYRVSAESIADFFKNKSDYSYDTGPDENGEYSRYLKAGKSIKTKDTNFSWEVGKKYQCWITLTRQLGTYTKTVNGVEETKDEYIHIYNSSGYPWMGQITSKNLVSDTDTTYYIELPWKIKFAHWSKKTESWGPSAGNEGLNFWHNENDKTASSTDSIGITRVKLGEGINPENFAWNDFYSLLRVGKTAFTVQTKIKTDFNYKPEGEGDEKRDLKKLASEVKNYGIEITASFYNETKGENEPDAITKKYILNINDISGNPYILDGSQWQYKTFEDDFSNLKQIDSIKTFIDTNNTNNTITIIDSEIHLQVRRDDIEPVTKTEYFYRYTTTQNSDITPPTSGWVTKEKLQKPEDENKLTYLYLWEWKKVTVIAYELNPNTNWYQITSTETNDYHSTTLKSPTEDSASSPTTSAPKLSQIDVFNALTNNGSDQGIFYGFLGSDNTIKKVRPYYTSEGGGSKISETFSIVNEDGTNESQGSNIARNQFGLYINASMIKTGILQVGGTRDSSNNWVTRPRFYADVDKKDIIIGGWSVDHKTMWSWADGSGKVTTDWQQAKYVVGLQNPYLEDDTRVFVAGTYDKTGSEGSSWAKTEFQVHKDGSMYSTKGKIGGWILESNKLYASPTSGKINGAGMAATDYLGNPAFWAGMSTYDNPWAATAAGKIWTSYTKFYVTNTGSIHAEDGDIGGWTIGPNFLTSQNGNISLDSDEACIKLKRTKTKIIASYPFVSGAIQKDRTVHFAVIADSNSVKNKTHVFEDIKGSDGVIKNAIRIVISNNTCKAEGLSVYTNNQFGMVYDKYAYVYFQVFRDADDSNWISPEQPNSTEGFVGTVDNLHYASFLTNTDLLKNMFNSYVNIYYEGDIETFNADTFIPN